MKESIPRQECAHKRRNISSYSISEKLHIGQMKTVVHTHIGCHCFERESTSVRVCMCVSSTSYMCMWGMGDGMLKLNIQGLPPLS